MDGGLIIGPNRPARRAGRGVLVWLILLALAGIGVARLFFYEVVVVRGNSMAPAVLDGDVLLMEQRAVPGLGDLVLVETAEEGPVLRRILGLPGDRLAAEDGRLLRNDLPIEVRRVGTFAYRNPEEEAMPPRRQHYVREAPDEGVRYHVLGDHVGNVKPWRLEFGTVDVPPGRLFVLCDNRPTCPSSPNGPLIQARDVVGVVHTLLWTGTARVDAPRTERTPGDASVDQGTAASEIRDSGI